MEGSLDLYFPAGETKPRPDNAWSGGWLTGSQTQRGVRVDHLASSSVLLYKAVLAYVSQSVHGENPETELIIGERDAIKFSSYVKGENPVWGTCLLS